MIFLGHSFSPSFEFETTQMERLWTIIKYFGSDISRSFGCARLRQGSTVDFIKTDNITVVQILAAAQLSELWMAGLEPVARQSLTVSEVGKAYRVAFDAVVS